MAGTLHGKRIAILATDGVEQVELTEPRDAVTAEGAETEIVSLESGKLQAMNHDMEPADMFPIDRTAKEATAQDYDALLMPGGTVNADKLRVDPDVRGFVQSMFRAGQAGRRDLPRPLDVDRRRSRSRPHPHLVPEHLDRPAQRRRHRRRRGGRHRRRPGVQPQPGGPAGVLRAIVKQFAASGRPVA